MGSKSEYDALPSRPITKFYLLNSDIPFLSSVVVSGQTPVNITDSEIYTATVDSDAPDLTYLWTVTGTTDATINGSATSSTVTIDYAGTPGDPDSFADVKCVVSSIDVGSSVEDTLQVTVEHVAIIAWTQSFQITDTVNDVIYGIDPAIEAWKDYGTSGVNITQTNPSNQPSVVTGATPADNYLSVGSDADKGFNDVISNPNDFTHLFEMDLADVLGYYNVLVGYGADQGLQMRTINKFNMRSVEGTDNDFTTYIATGGFKKYAFIKEGTVGKLYVEGILVDTIATLSGTFDGLNTIFQNSLTPQRVKLKVYKNIDRALTDQEAIDETT